MSFWIGGLSPRALFCRGLRLVRLPLDCALSRLSGQSLIVSRGRPHCPMKSLTSFLSGRMAAGAFPDPAPDKPFAVIGDLHGRADLLHALLDKITSEQLVFVGDYIDRGDDSAGVLETLYELQSSTGGRIVCLRGNHEDMALKFLDAPRTAGARWLRNGGLQTLASYGIGQITELADEGELAAIRDALERAMGEKLIGWLRSLPLQWKSGNVAVVHAAADPDLPMDAQENRTLLWGHRSFRQRRRNDGIWVAHGHTIVDEASAEDGRIAVDTGAYATGRLTAAQIFPGRIEFLQA